MLEEVKVTHIPTPAGARSAIEHEFFPEGATPGQIQMLDRMEASLQEMWSVGYQAAEMVSEIPWSNSACLGYMIMVAKSLKYSEDEIKRLVGSTRSRFDLRTVKEATKVYYESPY